MHGSSTIHVEVLVGDAPPTVYPQAQDNRTTQVGGAKSAPAATPKVPIQIYERNQTAAWLTVALYFMVSVNFWILACQVGVERWFRERGAWRSIAVVFLALGIYQQLDLGAALTRAGRAIAHHQGWYGHREVVQLAFIAHVALTSMVIAIALLIWARHTPKSARFALAGTTAALCFIAIRAISYHYVDGFLGRRVLGVRWDSVLEMGGIAVVLLGSLWRHAELPRLPRIKIGFMR